MIGLKIISRGALRRIMCLPDVEKTMTTIARRTTTRTGRRNLPATDPTLLPATNPPLGILSVSAALEDHEAVRHSASGLPCLIQTAKNCHSAFQTLENGRISIVVCERDLPDGTWRDVLEHLGSSPERPFLIVTSRLADGWLWAEVLNLGGYDVLAKPFDAKETRHVLETACLGRCDWSRGQRTMIAT